MNLDQYGLPVQANGDANDQLQRVGMILTAAAILDEDMDISKLEHDCLNAISSPNLLQPSPGVFVRHPGGDPQTTSGDQLISALASFIAIGSGGHAFDMFKTCIQRFGFAQNTKDGLNDSTQTKTPDFFIIRALPLFLRMSPVLYPIAFFADALLVVSALLAVGPVWRDEGGFKARSPDDVDDNSIILTLGTCRSRYPTLFSYLAIKLYSKLRPQNLGNEINRPYGALKWYHRAGSGGNPEIAEMWKPICERYFV